MRETQNVIQPSRNVPPAQPLAARERGRLGDNPPRAVGQGGREPTTGQGPTGGNQQQQRQQQQGQKQPDQTQQPGMQGRRPDQQQQGTQGRGPQPKQPPQTTEGRGPQQKQQPPATEGRGQPPATEGRGPQPKQPPQTTEGRGPQQKQQPRQRPRAAAAVSNSAKGLRTWSGRPTPSALLLSIRCRNGPCSERAVR
jgi:hypothetical protein